MTAAPKGEKEGEKWPAPIGFARKQDLLEYAPVVVLYDKEPAPENGCRAVKLYSEDQVNAILAQS